MVITNPASPKISIYVDMLIMCNQKNMCSNAWVIQRGHYSCFSCISTLNCSVTCSSMTHEGVVGYLQHLIDRVFCVTISEVFPTPSTFFFSFPCRDSREEYLNGLARDNTQLLLNKLWEVSLQGRGEELGIMKACKFC